MGRGVCAFVRVASAERVGYIARFMLEPDDEMHRVITHLVRCHLRLEIKSAEGAFTATSCIQLRVEIEDALACKIDNPQVGITRALHVTLRGPRKIAAQTRSRVE